MARKVKPDEPEMEQGVLDPEFAPVKYDAICDRLPYTQAEKEAHDSLLNVMMEEGVEHYVYKGVEAHCNISRKVKVKVESGAKKDDTNGESEE